MERKKKQHRVNSIYILKYNGYSILHTRIDDKKSTYHSGLGTSCRPHIRSAIAMLLEPQLVKGLPVQCANIETKKKRKEFNSQKGQKMKKTEVLASRPILKKRGKPQQAKIAQTNLKDSL
jgi:hypothetical protein